MKWKRIHNKSSMPKQDCDLLMMTDIGEYYIAYWDGKIKTLYASVFRNELNKKGKRILVGKVDSYTIKFTKYNKGMLYKYHIITKYKNN